MHQTEAGAPTRPERPLVGSLIVWGGFLAAVVTVVVCVCCTEGDKVIAELFDLEVRPTSVSGVVGDTGSVTIRTYYEGADVGTISVSIDLAGADFLDTVDAGDLTAGTGTQNLVFLESGRVATYEFQHTIPDHAQDDGWDWSEQALQLDWTAAGTSAGPFPIDLSVTFDGENERTATIDVFYSDVPTCIEDPVADWIDSILGAAVTFAEPWFDISCYDAGIDTLTAGQAEADFNGSSPTYQCNSTTGGRRVVCPYDLTAMPEGELVTVTCRHEAPIPDADAGHSYIYSVVFDSDGDPSDDWQYVPPYDGDYFQGADRWYQCIYDHASSYWEVVVSQVDSSMTVTEVSSTARAVIEGETITWYIGRSELPADPLGYRVTSFGHDGVYSPSDRGGDVSGANATEPLVGI